jgi:hypothetical protein
MAAHCSPTRTGYCRLQAGGSVNAGGGVCGPKERPMPYRYEVEIVVTLVADGQHADGDGAKALADRLAQQIGLDPRVDGVTARPPKYIGEAR